MGAVVAAAPMIAGSSFRLPAPYIGNVLLICLSFYRCCIQNGIRQRLCFSTVLTARICTIMYLIAVSTKTD